MLISLISALITAAQIFSTNAVILLWYFHRNANIFMSSSACSHMQSDQGGITVNVHRRRKVLTIGGRPRSRILS